MLGRKTHARGAGGVRLVRLSSVARDDLPVGEAHAPQLAQLGQRESPGERAPPAHTGRARGNLRRPWSHGGSGHGRVAIGSACLLHDASLREQLPCAWADRPIPWDGVAPAPSPPASAHQTAMPITLSDLDLVRLEAAQRTLLSSMRGPDIERWCEDCSRAVKTLIGADMATFVVPLTERVVFQSEELSPEILSAYPVELQPLREEVPVGERMRSQGVFSRASLWHPHEEVLYRSEYYNDYIVPARAFDTVGLAVQGQDGASPLPAHLMFHHDRPNRPQFGQRGLQLLRLLLPAFQTGLWFYLHLSQQREAFARHLDTLPEGVLLYGINGRVLHRNSSLERMLAEDSEAEQIEGALLHVARSLAALLQAPGDGSRRAGAPPLPSQGVRTSTATYRVRGSLVKEGLFTRAPALLIALERLTPALPSEEVIRQRWGLTQAQVRVARRMAEGKSNAEIARELFVSLHTVRRHAEAVRMKLGVHSRAEVASKILQG